MEMMALRNQNNVKRDGVEDYKEKINKFGDE